MGNSSRRFLTDLYKEFLEEASFLYQQRRERLFHSDLSWLEFKEDEERFEAQIDGLVVGGNLALQTSLERGKTGDMGEAHVATRVFCRQKKKDMFFELLNHIEKASPEKMDECADALSHELPETWTSDVLSLLNYSNPAVQTLSAKVIGYRRLPAGAALLSHFETDDLTLKKEIVASLGTLGHIEARDALFSLLSTPDATIQAEVARALLQLRDPEAMDLCVSLAHHEEWALIPAALTGRRDAFEAVLAFVEKHGASHSALVALGVLGFPDGIPHLLVQLENPVLASTSAESLRHMTGFNPREEVFVPDEMQEEEFFDDEKENLRSGQMPKRIDGQSYGETKDRLSQNPADWRKHNETCNPFQIGSRLRGGVPFSIEALFGRLRSSQSRYPWRMWDILEAQIQFKRLTNLEWDMFVDRQLEMLTA